MTESMMSLDQELIAKVKAIQIRASHLADDVFAGEYESAFKGSIIACCSPLICDLWEIALIHQKKFYSELLDRCLHIK